MSKERYVKITISLPESQLEQIDAANPNRSGEIQKALRAWYGRDATPEELMAADDVVDRAAQARAKAQRKEATP
ncbi:MAG: hypothetical protein WC565_10795 [Parcubacteria group bacterium]|jgi:Arc/MetJ-type ribon-helix-helix transcriptional regulator